MAKARGRGSLRRQACERARGCCEYCRSQERFAMQAFSADHIVARSHRGETQIENIAWACQGCNNHKYNKAQARDPVTGDLVPLYHPRRQRWADHFAWTMQASHIVGISAVGRATVEALRLNRKGLVNLRRVLFEVGKHPPQI